MKKLLILLISILIISCSTEENIDVKKYPIITTVHELAEYYDLNIDKSGKHETTSITTYIDGASEIDYAYELLDSEIHDQLFYSITIEKEKTVKEAKSTYQFGKGALELASGAFGQGVIEIDSIKIPSDDSYYALRTLEDEPNGMYFIVRKETNIYTMIISGLYTLDHSLIKDLLIPKISTLENFEIDKE